MSQEKNLSDLEKNIFRLGWSDMDRYGVLHSTSRSQSAGLSKELEAVGTGPATTTQRHNDQPWGYEVLNSTHIKITKADEPFRMQKALPLMSAYSLLVLSMNHSTKTPLTLHARCLHPSKLTSSIFILYGGACSRHSFHASNSNSSWKENSAKAKPAMPFLLPTESWHMAKTNQKLMAHCSWSAKIFSVYDCSGDPHPWQC